MFKLLYNKLITDIAKIVKSEINEMARLTVNRTIDKKLWLTVSSICSRNRSTEAENVKPLGNNKDNLLLRYVAALLIMKKQCPKSEEDIELLKTFKNIGKKYLELGGSINDILKLYNENSSNLNTSSTILKNKENINNKPILKEIKNNNDDLFNDDLFDDSFDDSYDDIDLSRKISGADKTLSLKNVYINLFKESKPKGFNYIKSDGYNYDKYIREDKDYLYGSTYIKNILNKLKSKNWDVIKIEYPHINYIGTDHDYETMSKEELNDYIDKVYTITNSNNASIIKNIYKTYFNNFNYILNNDPNKVVRRLLKENKFIKYLLISPDGGLVLYMERIKGTNDSYRYVLTFTGEVDYSDIALPLQSSIDIINDKKEEDKKRVKLGNFIFNYCHLSRSWSKYIKIDDNGYPYIIIKYLSVAGRDLYNKLKNKPKYFILLDNTDDLVVGHFITDTDCLDIILKYENSQKTYIYVEMRLTDKGKKIFNKL